MPIKLVIADIRMPGLDGIEMCRQVRADPDARIAEVPIILLSGAQETDLKERALEAGATDFVEKPISPVRLKELIALYLPQDAP